MRCKIEGCEKEAKQLLMCGTHYNRDYLERKATGKLLYTKGAKKARALEAAKQTLNVYQEVQKRLAVPETAARTYPYFEMIKVWHTSDGREWGSEMDSMKWELGLMRERLANGGRLKEVA